MQFIGEKIIDDDIIDIQNKSKWKHIKGNFIKFSYSQKETFFNLLSKDSINILEKVNNNYNIINRLVYKISIKKDIDKIWEHFIESVGGVNNIDKDLFDGGEFKNTILNEYNLLCGFCECNSKDGFQLDHIEDKATHKSKIYDYNNLQLLCKTCNNKKLQKVCLSTRNINHTKIIDSQVFGNNFNKNINIDSRENYDLEIVKTYFLNHNQENEIIENTEKVINTDENLKHRKIYFDNVFDKFYLASGRDKNCNFLEKHFDKKSEYNSLIKFYFENIYNNYLKTNT